MQKTEIVETSKEQVFGIISETLRGRFTHAGIQGAKDVVEMLVMKSKIPYVSIQVWEIDNRKNTSVLCRTYPHVYNLSPRQVRINIELAIRNRQTQA